MSSIYLEENLEFSSVLKARDKQKELAESGISASEIKSLHRLKIDNKTMMYFRTKEARQNFITKHRNRRTGKYDFMTRQPLFEGESSK